MEQADSNDKFYPEISDEDIYEGMKDIQGYLDITPPDLREIYRHAFRHALERISRSVKAADIMSRTVYHVSIHTPLKDVAALMAEKRISGLPVLDGSGNVAGVISEKDFLTRIGASATAHVMDIISAWLEGKELPAQPGSSKTAADIMASPAITVQEETPVFEITDLFNKKKINRAPVLDRSGRLTGIVSRADILRPLPGGQA
ncbi:MAG: CBS domain-containing protein [Nitrospirae bacterium]|nr:MAG: CBS domain-containing protein [Nitrospirota bacterium]